jgi:uncharacterized protein (TIGR02145 family)
MKKLNLLFTILFAFIFIKCEVNNNNISVDGCSKPHGNSEIVKICNQIWMKKNLDIDHYRNGDSIPEIRDPNEWGNLTTGAWCYYDNDTANGKIYGKLYNWYAVNDPRGLAPDGWHVASNNEWMVLINCLGGYDIAGGKLKESGIIHWNSPNEGATNNSGFTGLPGGWRYDDHSGNFYLIGRIGNWWTSSENDSVDGQFYQLGYNDIGFSNSGNAYKVGGYSVRCVKD